MADGLVETFQDEEKPGRILLKIGAGLLQTRRPNKSEDVSFAFQRDKLSWAEDLLGHLYCTREKVLNFSVLRRPCGLFVPGEGKDVFFKCRTTGKDGAAVFMFILFELMLFLCRFFC